MKFHFYTVCRGRVESLVALSLLTSAIVTFAADVESRRLTHYIPQDLLESAVRKEGWSEIKLDVKGGILKGDVVRIWSGGSIDRGNGDQPGQFVGGPEGVSSKGPPAAATKLAISQNPTHEFALIFKTDGASISKCQPPGKPLEIKMTKDAERLWMGFNDEKGRYYDNHIGRGRRHELDPLWIRIEVVRIVVD